MVGKLSTSLCIHMGPWIRVIGMVKSVSMASLDRYPFWHLFPAFGINTVLKAYVSLLESGKEAISTH